MHYSFQFGEVLKHWPDLLTGALITLVVAFIAFWIGCTIGLLGALAEMHARSGMRKLVRGYVVFFTNTPSLIQIFVLFYGLPDVGIVLSPMTAVLIGLSLNAGAYLTDIMRSGLVSVSKTELEAAASLNMSAWQSFRYVTLPHLAKTIYPLLSNFFIWILLGSSIGGLFGVNELTGVVIEIGSSTFRSIESFAVAAGMYVVLTFIASAFLYAIGYWCFRVRARFI
ncbi:amino acid ABC transporter permease [Pantoea sp. BAV 3049]|uniref:amino acid ABC transporter permease n=1 Tax=Pantoea sp. BAV 3049 TaxID=2654188 RepID=UPI00131B6650|nr:amino acid ABC transporter permease [Pantoea sp. BAV 3049]